MRSEQRFSILLPGRSPMPARAMTGVGSIRNCTHAWLASDNLKHHVTPTSFVVKLKNMQSAEGVVSRLSAEDVVVPDFDLLPLLALHNVALRVPVNPYNLPHLAVELCH